MVVERIKSNEPTIDKQMSKKKEGEQLIHKNKVFKQNLLECFNDGNQMARNSRRKRQLEEVVRLKAKMVAESACAV